MCPLSIVWATGDIISTARAFRKLAGSVAVACLDDGFTCADNVRVMVVVQLVVAASASPAPDSFCSLGVLGPTVGHTMDVLSPFISVILTDSSTESPVHALMLSIQAVRGLPRLRAPVVVPYIIFFSRQLPCFLVV